MPTLALGNLSPTQIATAVTAIGALGGAAYGLVDASKLIEAWLPNSGFAFIERTAKEFSPNAPDAAEAPELSNGSLVETLKSNWLSGRTIDEQKPIAKTLIKLRMSPENAAQLGQLTGLDQASMVSIAHKLKGDIKPQSTDPPNFDPNALTLTEQNIYGRFDVLLSTVIDTAYERANQKYVATAKTWSGVVAVLLSLLAAFSLGYAKFPNPLNPGNFFSYFDHNGHNLLIATLVGLVATPLAPVAKNLSTAILNASTAVQSLQK